MAACISKRIQLWCLTQYPSFLSQSLPHPADVSYAMKQSDYEEEEEHILKQADILLQK